MEKIKDKNYKQNLKIIIFVIILIGLGGLIYIKSIKPIDNSINQNNQQTSSQYDSVVESKKFDADVYIFSKEEGGRNTPIYANYRPQFRFENIETSGTINLKDGVEMINPGNNAKITVELFSKVAMTKGTNFAIYEGKKLVGNGNVTSVY